MSTSEIDLGGDSTIESHQPESPPTRKLRPLRTFRPLLLRLHFYAGSSLARSSSSPRLRVRCMRSHRPSSASCMTTFSR